MTCLVLVLDSISEAVLILFFTLGFICSFWALPSGVGLSTAIPNAAGLIGGLLTGRITLVLC